MPESPNRSVNVIQVHVGDMTAEKEAQRKAAPPGIGLHIVSLLKIIDAKKVCCQVEQACLAARVTKGRS